MTNPNNSALNEEKIELTHEMILDYERDNPQKALETLNLIKAVQHKLKEHCERKSDALSYNQVRNILLEIQKNEKNLVSVIPKLAYMEAKQEKTNQKELIRYLRLLLEKAIVLSKTKVFIEFMEIFVAYYKYYSSK